jgi:hypothetical protein
MFECIDKNVVNEQVSPIIDFEQKYKDEITRAKEIYLKIAKLKEILRKYYIEATDFNDVDALRIRILKTIKELKVKTGQ